MQNWDLFLRFVDYHLNQVEAIINNCRSEIYRSKEVIREKKNILEDAFIYFRKLHNMFKADRLVERVREEIMRTIPVYDTLVKATSYSRFGIQPTPLDKSPTIPSRIRAIFESSL